MIFNDITHSRSVAEDVWSLYQKALELWGPIATSIEWDHNSQEWPELQAEQVRAGR